MGAQFSRVRRTLEWFGKAEPGKRFGDFHDRWPLARGVTVTAGLALIAFGVAVGWLPGPGGFVAIFGLALLAAVWRPLAEFLDNAELRTRCFWRRLCEAGGTRAKRLESPSKANPTAG